MEYEFTRAVFTDQIGKLKNEALAIWEKSPQHRRAGSQGSKLDPLQSYVLEQAREAYRHHPDELYVEADDSTEVIAGQTNSVELKFEVWHCDGVGFDIRRHAIWDIWVFGRPDTSASLVLKVRSVNIGAIPAHERSAEHLHFVQGLSN